MLGRVTGPNSMTYPFMESGRWAARLEPTEAYPTTSLAGIAPGIGAELAARLTVRLEQRLVSVEPFPPKVALMRYTVATEFPTER